MTSSNDGKKSYDNMTKYVKNMTFLKAAVSVNQKFLRNEQIKDIV